MERKNAVTLIRSRSGLGRPFPEQQRARALEYARQRRSAGAGIGRIARELGVSGTTLRKWMAAPAFVEVKVIDDEPTSRSLVVGGPCGLRIEGMTLDTLVELLRRLS
jgi:hypothetical protein